MAKTGFTIDFANPIFRQLRSILSDVLKDALREQTGEGDPETELEFWRMPYDTSHEKTFHQKVSPIERVRPDDIIISLDDGYYREAAGANFFRLKVTRYYDPYLRQFEPLPGHGLHSWVFKEVAAIADEILGRIYRHTNLSPDLVHQSDKNVKARKVEIPEAKVTEFFDRHHVWLMDDGLFSGGTLKQVALALMDRGIPIHKLCAGINKRSEGDELVNTLERHKKASKFRVIKTAHFVPHLGSTIRTDPDKKSLLKDWISERDFFIGFPRSGKTVLHPEYENLREKLKKQGAGDLPPIGVPYLETWNRYAKESLNFEKGVPAAFTRELNRASTKFWEWMNKCNSKVLETRLGQKSFKVRDLPRFPFNYVPRRGGRLWDGRKFREILKLDITDAIRDYEDILAPPGA